MFRKISTFLFMSQVSIALSVRTTLTLGDKTLLRGATPAVLLEQLGLHLSSSSGDDGTYGKSFPVCRLDYFLSHSWHAPWRHKFATLLVYFNSVAACIGCCSGAYAFGLYKYSSTTENKLLVIWIWGSGRIDLLLQTYAKRMLYLLLLVVIFVIYWGKIRARLCFRLLSIFLDKVCIHQTDKALKLKGIKSIGAILASTNCLLIVWDKSYFTRLWCVYEIAAFLYSKPNGRIVLLLVRSGYFTIVLSIIVCLARVLDNLALDINYLKQGDVLKTRNLVWMMYVHITLWIAFGMVLSAMCWGYAEELSELDRQLQTFSVRSSNCYCCSVGHMHPETGTELLCDRRVVYGSIRHWYPGSCEAQSLAGFDQLVQKRISQDWLLRDSAVIPVIPYSFVCFISCPSSCGMFFIAGYLQFFDPEAILEIDVLFDWKVSLVFILAGLEYALLRFPLLIALGLWINTRFHVACACASAIARTCGMLVLSCVFLGLYDITIRWCLSMHDLDPSHHQSTNILILLVAVLEIIMVWVIFGRTNRGDFNNNDGGGETEIFNVNPSANK